MKKTEHRPNNEWNNYDNIEFYEKLMAYGLKDVAEKAGLANGPDILFLKDYWINAKKVLDVGSGYGRLIDCLLQHGYDGEIVTFERCITFFNHLQNKYLSNTKIHNVHIDIHNIPSDCFQPFDTIFWLWSGIADFSQGEQLSLVCNLAKLLKKEGFLIIDTMPEGIIPLGAHQEKTQYYITAFNKTTVHTYEPTREEVFGYAKAAGFNKIIQKHCKTDIGRERALYILSFM